MGAWYTIGVAVGVGVAIGVFVHGVVRDTRIVVPLAILAGAAVGYVLEEFVGAAAGGIGAVLGSLGASPVVRGALARGGTRGGTALFVAGGALAIAALALVPVVGYLLAVALPALAVRLRRRHGERHAGLRILARD